MTQGKASKEEAESCKEALEEVMKAMPKSKAMDFIGHFNDLFLFLDAVARVLPSEKVEQTTSPNPQLNSTELAIPPTSKEAGILANFI